MRRASGRRICQPGAIPGDEVAARARGRYAASRGDSAITGSIPARRAARPANRHAPYSAYDEELDRGLPDAVPGED